MTEPTTLYRLFDRAGVLLYVGITRRQNARTHQHWAQAPWWQQVWAQTFEHHPTPAAAADAERAAIADELPVYNIRHAADGAAQRRALYQDGNTETVLLAQAGITATTSTATRADLLLRLFNGTQPQRQAIIRQHVADTKRRDEQARQADLALRVAGTVNRIGYTLDQVTAMTDQQLDQVLVGLLARDARRVRAYVHHHRTLTEGTAA